MSYFQKKIHSVGNSEMPLISYTFTGEAAGPKILITAGVHGSEYPGILACRQLIKHLKTIEIQGQVTIIPLVNEQAFYHYSRFVTPEDGINLNRAFPSQVEGGLTNGLAQVLESYFAEKPEVYLDLHSGDTSEIATAFAYTPFHAADTVRIIADKALKALDIKAWTYSYSKIGAISQASLMGVPALLVERGGRGLWDKEEVNAYYQDLLNVLKAYGVVSGEAREYSPIYLPKVYYHEATCEGFWYLESVPGERVQMGTSLGRLEDLDGNTLLSIEAPSDGIILYATTGLGVKKGDPLVALGTRLE